MLVELSQYLQHAEFSGHFYNADWSKSQEVLQHRHYARKEQGEHHGSKKNSFAVAIPMDANAFLLCKTSSPAPGEQLDLLQSVPWPSNCFHGHTRTSAQQKSPLPYRYMLVILLPGKSLGRHKEGDHSSQCRPNLPDCYI